MLHLAQERAVCCSSRIARAKIASLSCLPAVFCPLQLLLAARAAATNIVAQGAILSARRGRLGAGIFGRKALHRTHTHVSYVRTT